VVIINKCILGNVCDVTDVYMNNVQILVSKKTIPKAKSAKRRYPDYDV